MNLAPLSILVNNTVFRTVKLLGKGSFGKCYLYENGESKIAIKAMERNKMNNRELALHRRLTHPNVIQVLSCLRVSKF